MGNTKDEHPQQLLVNGKSAISRVLRSVFPREFGDSGPSSTEL